MSTPLEMNPEIRARWVAELRSGKYEQRRELLRTLGGDFCCLGVLCEMAVQDGVIAPAYLEAGVWVYVDSEAELPEAVRRWAGLGSLNPDSPAGEETLAGLNDGDDERAAWTFAQIAAVIEGSAA